MITSCSLQTGSNGNCFYVETPDTKLIIDAGISGKQAQLRLKDKKRDLWDADAILISHNHTDHSRCAGTFQRKIRKPLYMTTGSFAACEHKLGVLYEHHTYTAGSELKFKDTTVQTIPTPHDGEDSVVFIISYDNKKLGIFTDLGHCFAGLGEYISDLDAIYLESNYDPDMLENGPYPLYLRQRISGDAGHITNAEAAHLLKAHAKKLQWAVLSHLSENNNTPVVAVNTARDILGNDLDLWVAPRYDSFKMLTVE